MIGQWFARRFDIRLVRQSARQLGVCLVVLGTVGIVLDTVGNWPPVVTIVGGMACLLVGVTGKKGEAGPGNGLHVTRRFPC